MFSLQNLNPYTAYESSHGLREKYPKSRLFLWGFHHGHKPVPNEAPTSPNALFFPLCRAMTSRFESSLLPQRSGLDPEVITFPVVPFPKSESFH